MIKALLGLFGLIILTSSISFAQLNVDLISKLEYPVEANDIWGWVDPDDSTEYALVGLQNGVSIVSLADPASPQEVANIPGQNSTWRDLKTWGNFAYVTTDQPGTTDGLLVIDLSTLPDSVTYENLTEFPGLGSLFTCHNLYIDENGICYLAGCEQNGGGMLLFDVATDPGNPIYLGASLPVYAHDVYVRDGLMYASEIYAGDISIYDFSDLDNIELLGSRPTEFTFTHNAWLSDDGNTIFTTDERANAPVGAYDVSDPTDIVELDQFRPSATLGAGVIPHNVHVFNDYLVISHYTDGLVIADAARPGNLIEVGVYDTWPGPDGGFNGAWGAYPFLPSGLILVSDIQRGLFVLDPDYNRGCYLEGVVRDVENASPLNGV
jgi:choice-of-anchor B domain-containing protein